MSRTYRGKQEKLSPKRYFNTHYFDKIKKIINTDPLKAKKEFEEYMMKYPLDYSAQTIYVSVLIRLQQFELAEKMLEEIELRMEKDGNFKTYYEKKDLDETSVVFCRSALLCYQQRYSELYEFVLKTKYNKKKLKIDSLITYCRKKLGILNINRETQTSYVIRQIIEYSEEEMLEHIKDHFEIYNDQLEDENDSKFVRNFPFDEVLKEIKKCIPSTIRICNGIYDDTYVFKYDHCGNCNYKPVNYFKVICFENTNQIITIYPCTECEKLPFVDLNYMKEQEETKKIKALSQREKFLKRYKK